MNSDELKLKSQTPDINDTITGSKAGIFPNAMGKIRSIHFIGIGGISMSSLAAIADNRGYRVSGSDDDGESDNVLRLKDKNICVRTPLKRENIDEFSPDAVVYTAAIHEDNPELMRVRELNIPCFTRSEFLGMLMKEYKTRIGVSGTHGKSTTTAMIYSISDAAAADATLCCGAVLPSISNAYAIGEGDGFIYEACEYTDSFLSFFPTSALILNIELDHTDYFRDLDMLISSFSKSVIPADKVFTLMDDENCQRAVIGFSGEKIFISPDNANADYYADNVESLNGRYCFDVMRHGEKLERVCMSIPGKHNMTNALFAFASSYENGIPAEFCKKGLESFMGIDRRFELVGQFRGRDVYIDYAHHPGEIRTTVATAREMNVSRLVVIFQSHTHTRTAKFVREFAQELSKCDEVLITHTYAAREAVNNTGVSAEDLAGMIPCARYTDSFEEAVEYIIKNGKENDTYIFMGAGAVNKAAYDLISHN